MKKKKSALFKNENKENTVGKKRIREKQWLLKKKKMKKKKKSNLNQLKKDKGNNKWSEVFLYYKYF
jgi:hypothetical protein